MAIKRLLSIELEADPINPDEVIRVYMTQVDHRGDRWNCTTFEPRDGFQKWLDDHRETYIREGYTVTIHYGDLNYRTDFTRRS